MAIFGTKKIYKILSQFLCDFRQVFNKILENLLGDRGVGWGELQGEPTYVQFCTHHIQYLGLSLSLFKSKWLVSQFSREGRKRQHSRGEIASLEGADFGFQRGLWRLA